MSLDWSVAMSIWSKNGLHNATIEATSIEGCRLIRVNSPNTKCFIYHNSALAGARDSVSLARFHALVLTHTLCPLTAMQWSWR